MAVRCLVSKRALNSFIDMVRRSCVVVFMKVNEFIYNGSQRQKYRLGVGEVTCLCIHSSQVSLKVQVTFASILITRHG